MYKRQGQGDEVEVAYAGELSSDVTKAESVDIVTSAAAEAEEEAEAEEDPIISGTIEEAGEDTPVSYTHLDVYKRQVSKVPMERVVKATLPFYLCMVITLLLITFIPGISMWLPTVLAPK